MARTGRQKLDSLHIPESDPAWKHVTYRSTSHNVPGAQSAAGPTARNLASSTDGAKLGTGKVDVPKRGVSSKEMKEKKVKQRTNSKAEIQMKDESVRAAPRTSNVNEQASPSPSKPVVPLRKTPGSGFKMGKSTSQDVRPNTTTESSSHVVLPRTKLVDALAIRDKETPHRLPQPVSPERKVISLTQPQRIRKIREDTGGGTDSEREKQAEHARVLRREKTRPREHGVIENSHAEEEEPSTHKRRKVIRDDDDYEATSSRSTSQKKRKLEDGSVFTPSSTGEESRVKDLSLPKKPELAPAFRPKVRREASPLPQQTPLPKIKKDIPRTSLSTQGGKASIHESMPSSPNNQPRKRDDSKVAYKTRRRSPIYTSSEDERSVRSPRRAISVGPLPTPPMTTHRASPAVPAAHLHTRSHSHARETRLLPTDHASLRVRYSTSYLEYLSKFRALVAQKGKIDSMLKSSDVVSAGSITDSDGDVELMDAEELARLSSECKVLEEELETIRNIFSSN
jgi:RNA polymerase II elongation factor ELL